MQPGFFWWGNELEDFCTSFASFGALAPLVFLLAFWGGGFSPNWMGTGWMASLHFFSFPFPFLSPAKEGMRREQSWVGHHIMPRSFLETDGRRRRTGLSLMNCLAIFGWLELAGWVWVGLLAFCLDDDNERLDYTGYISYLGLLMKYYSGC